MEGAAGDAVGEWIEKQTTDGKLYYYSTATKKTQWDKPLALYPVADVGAPDSSTDVAWVTDDSIAAPHPFGLAGA